MCELCLDEMNKELCERLLAAKEAVKTLRDSLTELVERRARAIAAVGGAPDGTDGRYARARAALELTKNVL